MESCIGLMSWAVLCVCLSLCGYCVVARDIGADYDQPFMDSHDLDWDQQGFTGNGYILVHVHVCTGLMYNG